jgi:hypothetical protein
VDNVAPDTGPKLSFEELRSAPRFALLIRSAKLIGETGEYLCIVRDVSATGVRLRMFHPLPPLQRMLLELSSGETFAVEPVWEREDHAGFRFADQIDVQRFINEAGPYPKRPLRLRVQFPATITVDGETLPAMVRDLSREGARIEISADADRRLAIRQKLKIEARGFPTVMGNVCWRSAPAYGIVFQQLFTFEELARLAQQLQPFGKMPAGAGDGRGARCA